MLSKKELGNYLKKIRTSKKLSLREVDKKADISYTYLNMIENGKRNVTPALLRNLANLYNHTIKKGVKSIQLIRKSRIYRFN